MSDTPASAPLLALRAVEHRYDDGTLALAGLDLELARGARLGIVGPSGAGKSTLLLHLNGILHPTSGAVEYLGVDLREQDLREIRRSVGIVFQDPDDMLFTTRLDDDVAFGPLHLGLPADEVAGRTREALAAVGLTGLEARLPHRLSGGEKRAASIAAVLSMRPSVLVLDEPSAGLDPRGRRRLVELLMRFDHTLVVASHDLELVLAVCTHVAVLDGGRLVASGTSRAILGDAALAAAHGLEVPLSLARG